MKYNLDEFKDRIGEIPQEPGVYIFRGGGKILYVGKASILPNRLKSYLKPNPKGDPKTAAMLSEAETVEVIFTETETDALLLEMNLIKENTPRYNISIHGFPYVKITDETYPLLTVSRENPEKTPGRFLGPYTDATNLRRNVYLINRAFRLRTCAYDLDKNPPKRPCLDYEMGLCAAPCIDAITPEDYGSRLETAIQFVRGKRRALFTDLERRMQKAAACQQYEEAATFRDMLGALKTVARGQRAVSRANVNLDAVVFETIADDFYAVILKVREGLLLDKLLYHGEPTPNGAGEEFILRHYSESSEIPPVILVKSMPGNVDLFEGYLSSLRGGAVKIVKPQRGRNAALLATAQKNLKYFIDAGVIDKARKGELAETTAEIAGTAGVVGGLKVIEFIDISNTGQTAVVGSLVTFVNGIPDKSRYRRYKIRGKMGQDDFASIAEVTRRRFTRVKSGEEEPPDLFIVDGGKGQLSASVKILTEMNLTEQPVGSLAKGERDEFYLPDKSSPEHLSDAAMLLLARIRDEAHRFAITYHRKLRGKRLERSILDDIPGVGPSRKRILLRHFGSVENMISATEEDIIAIPGIPPNVAKAVYRTLRGEDLNE